MQIPSTGRQLNVAMTSISHRRLLLGIMLCGTAAEVGCSSWVYTYQDAERAFQDQRKPRLIFFKDHLDPASGRMEDALQESGVKDYTGGMIRCKLVAQDGRNWNYVAQYGVDRFPALVVVHPDGTYHTLMGEHTVAQIAAFFAAARLPGSSPRAAGETPGQGSGNWLTNYQEAIRRHGEQNRRLLLVFKWWSSEPSAELIRRLQSPVIRKATSEMLVCVLDVDYPPNRQAAGQYGANAVPSMVLLESGRSPRVASGLPKVEDILRFVQGG